MSAEKGEASKWSEGWIDDLVIVLGLLLYILLPYSSHIFCLELRKMHILSRTSERGSSPSKVRSLLDYLGESRFQKWNTLARPFAVEFSSIAMVPLLLNYVLYQNPARSIYFNLEKVFHIYHSISQILSQLGTNRVVSKKSIRATLTLLSRATLTPNNPRTKGIWCSLFAYRMNPC